MKSKLQICYENGSTFVFVSPEDSDKFPAWKWNTIKTYRHDEDWILIPEEVYNEKMGINQQQKR